MGCRQSALSKLWPEIVKKALNVANGKTRLSFIFCDYLLFPEVEYFEMYCFTYFIHLLIILGMRANLVLTIIAPTFPEPCS